MKETMWKNTEQEEYEASAPAVKAHFHALRAEEAWKKEEFVQVEREARLASEKFIEAANAIRDRRTVDALMLLAENYEYRAHEAQVRIPNQDAHSDDGLTSRSPAVAGDTKRTSFSGRSVVSSMAVGGHEPIRAEGFTPMSSGLEGLDPQESAQAENKLNQAAEEIEELWRRLRELGLSSGGNADKNHVLMSSRHLSSSLGDSFCLLPTKARAPIGAGAVAVDGGSTLRAAVASRMRNQRVRLMEKQYGPRVAVDARLQPSRGLYDEQSKDQLSSFKDASHLDAATPPMANRKSSTTSGRGSGIHEGEELQDAVAHQKHEIVRLLSTVKTLSHENTSLLKKCDALSHVQEENRELQDSMEKFKTHYNQKLVMIKRALEEWRHQTPSQPLADVSADSAPSADAPRDPHLEAQLQNQQQQIQQLKASMAKRDAQLAKYEQWYQTLKAGARAKRNQSSSGELDSSSMGGSGPVPRDSFTNSYSLHELHGTRDAGDSATTGSVPPRPPAHPTRRAL